MTAARTRVILVLRRLLRDCPSSGVSRSTVVGRPWHPVARSDGGLSLGAPSLGCGPMRDFPSGGVHSPLVPALSPNWARLKRREYLPVEWHTRVPPIFAKPPQLPAPPRFRFQPYYTKPRPSPFSALAGSPGIILPPLLARQSPALFAAKQQSRYCQRASGLFKNAHSVGREAQNWLLPKILWRRKAPLFSLAVSTVGSFFRVAR